MGYENERLLNGNDPNHQENEVELNDTFWNSHRHSHAFIALLQSKYFLCASIFYLVGSMALLLAGLLYVDRLQIFTSQNAQLQYSPAQHLIKYKEVVFFPAFRNETKYQGEPSPELDQAWENLYNFGISKIPKEEAERLPNATSAIPGDESNYITELDVFHQLHCLNKIRQAFSPEYYNSTFDPDTEEAEGERMHIRHCIEHIRQGIVCHADISTVYWTWSKERQETLADARITHTCRDFDAIKDWALEHRLTRDFDKKTYIPGNPVHV